MSASGSELLCSCCRLPHFCGWVLQQRYVKKPALLHNLSVRRSKQIALFRGVVVHEGFLQHSKIMGHCQKGPVLQ
eukprot:4890982-Amphidinium_carterae.2